MTKARETVMCFLCEETVTVSNATEQWHARHRHEGEPVYDLAKLIWGINAEAIDSAVPYEQASPRMRRTADSYARQILDAGWRKDPLFPVIHHDPVTGADGKQYWPGDNRFAVLVRSIYGGHEVVVDASSLKGALEAASKVDFATWMEGPRV